MEIAILVIGVIIGFALAWWIAHRRSIGDLCLVQTALNPDPQPLLDLDMPFEAFRKRKYVLVRIVNIDTRK
jgi:hypothetical protein